MNALLKKTKKVTEIHTVEPKSYSINSTVILSTLLETLNRVLQ